MLMPCIFSRTEAETLNMTLSWDQRSLYTCQHVETFHGTRSEQTQRLAFSVGLRLKAVKPS